MSFLEVISELKKRYNIVISEGEDFKQALYNNKITDTPECMKDKIELIIKHYPGQIISLGTDEPDETSNDNFCYVSVTPITK